MGHPERRRAGACRFLPGLTRAAVEGPAWIRLEVTDAPEMYEEKGPAVAGWKSGVPATPRVDISALRSVLLDSGTGPSTAARVSLWQKENRLARLRSG